MKRTIALTLLFFLCLCTALPVSAAVYVDCDPPADWETRDLMRLTVFRTGEGDCMLLEAGGECMMIDGGPYKYRESLRDALEARGISHFKYLFSTHPHDDHLEGLRMLMNYGFTADAFLSTFAKNNSYDIQQKAVRQIDRSGIPYRRLASGDSVTLGGVQITFICWEEGSSINAQSCMARLEFGGCSALLCADAIGEAQRYYLTNLDPALLKADVIKAPHHGLTAIVTEFLDAVDPAFIWITNYSNYGSDLTGIKNQIKHRKLPAKYSGDGTIYLECDGTDWYIYQTLKQF